MIKISREEIEGFEKRYRVQLINSLPGVKSANIIGTKSKNGIENAAIVSSVMHLGSDPALMGFIQRPTTVQRDTYENIIETEFFTINHVNSKHIAAAHQTSARYDKDVSEFNEVGLTSFCNDVFYAPYVKESNVRIGLKFEEMIPIHINNTKLIVGSIEEIYISESCLNEDGSIEFSNLHSVGITGLDTYNSIEKLKRFSYAKPKIKLSEL